MHILITRTSNSIINFNTYNCQEIGLGKALTRKGHKVSFITAGEYEDFQQVEVDEGRYIDVYLVKCFSLNKNVCVHIGYDRLLETISPDIIHINSFSHLMSFLYIRWGKKHKKRTVVIQGNYSLNSKPILKHLEHLFNNTFGKYILNKTNAIGAKTYWAKRFVNLYTPKRVYLTRIGLDESKFLNAPRINWRAKLNLENKKVLLYVGIQEQRRNTKFLIDIMDLLPDDYVLLLVGDGPIKNKVNTLIEQKKLQNRCLQLGKVQQNLLPSLYILADLFLLPSNYEIFGMVILESMYFGTPVISTKTAGADTIITNDVDGVVIDTLNPTIWKNKILSIEQEPSLKKAMSVKAQKKISEELLWNKTVDEFLLLYKSELL